jgi:hypothetical protein
MVVTSKWGRTVNDGCEIDIGFKYSDGALRRGLFGVGATRVRKSDEPLRSLNGRPVPGLLDPNLRTRGGTVS